MERFKYDFNGKLYDAVELNGKCVSSDGFEVDTIVIADEELNNVLADCIEGSNVYDGTTAKAIAIDDEIFGFAPLNLILNGGESELENFAKSLL